MTKVVYFLLVLKYLRKKKNNDTILLALFFGLALNDQISYKNEKKMIIFKSRIKFKNFKLFKEAN